MFPRSPELMTAADTLLLVIDLQERLLPVIRDNEALLNNVRRLVCGATTLGMQIRATEQYPQGLGQTVALVNDSLPAKEEKRMFSCRECPGLYDTLRNLGVYKILVCGIETHVCVQQTVLDFMGEGFRIYIAVDAVGSRNQLDHETALRRLDSSGAVLTTTEAALFEWCETSAIPQFKAISKLVKDQP